MSPSTAHPAATRRAIRSAWVRNGIVWLALVALLATATAVAFLPWGAWGFAADILLSAAAAGLVGVVSMGARPLADADPPRRGGRLPVPPRDVHHHGLRHLQPRVRAAGPAITRRRGRLSG